jgi:prolyl-tRNA editing enzyme YbaK/EbsC (Cys-tRNA(Pro) deacylase)
VDERIAARRGGGGGKGVDDQHDAHENTGYGVGGVEPNSRCGVRRIGWSA